MKATFFLKQKLLFADCSHCVKSIQIGSYFWCVFSKEISIFNPNTGKYGPETTLYLDTFHAVNDICYKYICLLDKKERTDKSLLYSFP